MEDLYTYHVPVMLGQCIEGLAIHEDGIYVDVTFGGGGHSRAMVAQLNKGKVFGFDQDRDAVKNAEDLVNSLPEGKKSSFTLVEANFRHLKKYLRLNGIRQIDGLLADLGVSSHQINTGERGFSFRFEANLDMRMDQSSGKTAADILNTYEESELHKLFGLYGEVKNAKTLANAIIRRRAQSPLAKISNLTEVTKQYAPRGQEHKYNAQVFQALRIEVNEELKALEELIEQCAEVIKPGGRLVVMSYHSLEDRLVKNYIKEGKFYGQAEKDLFGNVRKPFESITRKPVEADEEEVKRNPRSRSAKLRIAERTEM